MSPRLRRTAFLLCGDWHTAEDLAQTALTKVFVSWRRIRRQEAVHAYTHRTLVNAYLAHRRLKRTGELLTASFPERAAQDPAPETRMMLLEALATLPPRTRAVVVLRYWADLSVEQVADVMGCSTGNVKKLSSRAMDKLRGNAGRGDGRIRIIQHPAGRSARAGGRPPWMRQPCGRCWTAPWTASRRSGRSPTMRCGQASRSAAAGS
jgi:RNA polymerase sigma-70 factor (sigma-E family)